MKPRMLSGAVLAAAFLGAASPAAAVYLTNGTPAPNFTKPQHLTQAARSLSEFHGKVVVLFETWYN
jgi:hypothetical protein